MDVAEFFGLNEAEAGVVLNDVADSTRRWQSVALQIGLRNDEIRDMAPAFEHEQSGVARTVAGG